MAYTEGLLQSREVELNLTKYVVVRIESATRPMKSESLVIVDQNATVNTFPALYTPPVTPWEWAAKEVGSLTGDAYHLWFMTGVKS